MTTELTGWLKELEQEIAPHFKPALLARDQTVFGFEFDEDAEFHLVTTPEAFSFDPGVHAQPTIRLFVSNHKTLKGLLTGSIDGMSAFMAGDYRADGNIVLSQLLLYIFMPSKPTIAYEVKE